MPPQSFEPTVSAPTVSSAPEGALMRWGRWLLILAPIAALLFATASASFPLSSAKFALFATLTALSAIAFMLSGGASLLARMRGRAELLLAATLPAAYLLSWWFSTDRSVALLGIGSETDTVLFVIVAFVALSLSYLYFRAGSSLRMLALAIGAAALAALVFQYVNVLVGVPGEAFSDPSSNVVGKWNDFGILVGTLALLCMGALELVSLSRRAGWGAWAALLLSLLMLGAVNFPTGWWMLLSAAVLVGVIGYLMRGSGIGARRIPWAPVLVGVVSVLFLLTGNQINAALTSVLKVSSLEVRPALSSTIDIGRASHDSAVHSLLGAGPNTFNQQWLAYKPTEVNQTQFWSVDFASGFSLLSGAFVTAGYLGIIVWLIPAMLVLLALWRLVRSSLPSEERALGVLVGLGAVYLWGMVVLYAPSPVIVLLAFVLAGGVLGFASTLRGMRDYTSRTGWFVASGVLLLLVLVSAWSALSADRRFLALAYSQKALVAVQGGDLSKGEELLNRSLSIERIGENLRLGTEMSLARMITIAQSTTTPADAQQQFAAAVQTAVVLAQEAAALNPKDYRPYLGLASVYRYLASLNVEGARESEMAAYAKAQELNGKNPAIPLLRAQLEASSPQGSASAIETYLTQSLQLKSNYTDALLFAVQLAVAQNNLTTAIQAQSAAVASAPDQAALWYQLGLLYYVGGDMENAVLALEKALSLVPDYANAQYFLGLSYYRQGNTEGAVGQFTALSRSNPDNASVTKILENLKAGKDPLEGVADAPGSQ